MMKADVSVHNWPHDVPFFGEGIDKQPSAGSGCRGIGVDNMRKLVDAFNSKSPPVFKAEEKDGMCLYLSDV